LLIKEGAGVELGGGDGFVYVGVNVPRTPGELHTVIDISGPGSRMLWRTTGGLVEYCLLIGGKAENENSAKDVTINISDSGSFVFDHVDVGDYSIGERRDVTINITGARSKMALITPGVV
jgi:hypothetical protein